MAVTVNSQCNYIYSNSYQEIPLIVRDANGNEIDANLYAEAEYRITDANSCTFDFSASLGSGISVIGTQFVLITQETDIAFNGEKRHFFRIGKNVGELEPPVFDTSLDVLPVCQV